MRKTREERFWSKVNKDGPTQPHMESECWIWTAATDADGYGRFAVATPRFACVSRRAHRASLEMATGVRPPDEQVVCHRCDNPPCVRPDHLFLGSPQENVADRHKKRRTAAGEKQGNSVLSETDVRAIRIAHECGVSARRLAEMFGVTRITIHHVASRRGWKHVTDEPTPPPEPAT